MSKEFQFQFFKTREGKGRHQEAKKALRPQEGTLTSRRHFELKKALRPQEGTLNYNT